MLEKTLDDISSGTAASNLIKKKSVYVVPKLLSFLYRPTGLGSLGEQGYGLIDSSFTPGVQHNSRQRA